MQDCRKDLQCAECGATTERCRAAVQLWWTARCCDCKLAVCLHVRTLPVQSWSGDKVCSCGFPRSRCSAGWLGWVHILRMQQRVCDTRVMLHFRAFGSATHALAHGRPLSCVALSRLHTVMELTLDLSTCLVMSWCQPSCSGHWLTQARLVVLLASCGWDRTNRRFGHIALHGQLINTAGLLSAAY